MPLIRRGASDQIKSNRIVQSGGIEVRHVLDTAARDEVEDVRGEVAMRINDANTVTCFNVLENQIAEQSCFARAGFPNGVEMMPPVFRKKNEGRFLPPIPPEFLKQYAP